MSMSDRRNKRILLIIWFLISASLFSLDLRSVWVTPWDLTSTEKIDKLIQDCQDNNINEILAEVRYRGDALYKANRINNRFPNPEEKSYIMNGSDFDPLQYLIEKAKPASIKVQAWVTVLVTSPASTERLNSRHLYFKKREWITYSADGREMPTNTLEGAYLDPALPEVRDYLANVFADIAINYDIDGIHLDYVRYPDHRWGFHPKSVKYFEKEQKLHPTLTWDLWKEQQVTSMIKTISERVKSVKPQLELSAAVKPDPVSAVKYFGQNWEEWLDKKYIDRAYLMAYQTKDESFNQLLNKLPEKHADKIVIGVRAWSDNNSYPAYLLRNKIATVIKSPLKGISFFSYSGINSQSYFATIKPMIHLFKNDNAKLYADDTNPFFNQRLYNICGKIIGLNYKAIAGARVVHKKTNQSSFTDFNGEFILYQVNENDTEISVEYFDQAKTYNAVLSQNESIPQNNVFKLNVFPAESLTLKIRAVSDNKNIYLFWNSPVPKSFALYRKKVYSPDNHTDIDFQFMKLMNESNTFFVDSNAEPFAQYEYKLIDSDMMTQGFIRVELDFEPHPVEFSYFKTEDLNYTIKLESTDSLTVSWSILDMNEKPLFYGINKSNSGLIKWNGKSIEGDLPDTDIFIFEYQINALPVQNEMMKNANHKWFRKYIY